MFSAVADDWTSSLRFAFSSDLPQVPICDKAMYLESDLEYPGEIKQATEAERSKFGYTILATGNKSQYLGETNKRSL